MTVTENNPHKISTMGTGTLAAVTDASDFPHTGLIKGLSQMARQNIVVKGSNDSATHDFNITQSPSSGGDNTATADVIQVAQGSYLRDGKLYTANAVNFPRGTTVNDTSLLIPTHDFGGGVSADKGYHLLVINSSNALKIRQPTTPNKVPDYTSGDTIIAIIEVSSTTVNGTRNIQFLTSDKTENSVSIAYTASNTYTETMSIIGDGDRTTFKNKIANADIRFVLADNTADEKFEILTDDDSDGDEGDTTVFSIDGQGKVSITGVDRNESDLVISKDVNGSIGRAGISLISDNSTNGQSGRLTLERTSGFGFIGMDIATDSRDGIRILTGDGSETERMRINDDGKVAIGTATVDTNSLLAVEGSISLDEISAPTSTGNRAQLYANADNELHMVDGAGVDTIFLKSGKHSIWVPSSAMTPLTTAGCSALTQVEMTAGRPELQVLDFAADADDHAQFTVAFPKSWNEGTVTFQPFWTVTGTNTGTAVWNLTGISANDNYAINSGYPAIAGTGAKAHSGTSNDLNVSAESGALTITNASVDSVTYFRLSLDTSSSSQTGAVRLIGLKLFYDINAGNDE